MKGRTIALAGAVLLTMLLVIGGCAGETAVPEEEDVPESDSAAPSDGTPAAAETEVFEWTYLHEHPSGSPLFNYVVNVADRIEEVSGGRLTIRIAAGGEIVPAYDIVEALKDGVAQIGWGDAAAQQKLIGPVGYLLTPTGLPGGPDPIELLAWYYIGGGEALANEIWGEWGTSVGCVPCEAELFCHSNVKLEELADFKGVKFRTMGLWGEVIQNQGAAVVTLSGSELYEAMQRGVIDAFEYCPPAQNWPMGFQEVADYIGVPGIHSPSNISYVLVNHAEWNGLPSDLQRIVIDQFKVGCVDQFLSMWYQDGVAMDDYEAYGTEVVTLSDDAQMEIAKAGLELCQKYAAEDATFKRVFDQQTAFYKTFRRATQEVAPTPCLFDFL